jgi:cell division protein FtsQ
MWNNARALNVCAVLIAVAAAGIFLAAAGIWLSHQPMFVLRSVRVEGESGNLRHVNAATVRAAALPHISGNFFSVNLETVRQAFEGVAWVRRARVRREWPNRLVVKIEEHQALGTWNDDRLLNTFGEVFAANMAEADSDLPHFYGPEGAEKDVAQRYLDFKNSFAAIGLRPIEVTLSARYAWSLRLANGTPSGLLVELGRETDANTLSERIARMLAAYPQVTSKWPRLTLVDLRYPNGFALRAEGLRIAAPQSAKPQDRPVRQKASAGAMGTRLPTHQRTSA